MSITRSHSIYFVCKGTSTNDIINSVNITFKEKKQSLMNSFWGKKPNNTNISNKQTKIELDQFSPLEDIGVKEMYMCKDSDNIIQNVNPDLMHIYTSLDLSAIESALILSQGKMYPITLTPLPYMSTDKKVNSTNLREFIELFGSLIVNTTNSRLYWNLKKSQFLNIDQIRLLIDWSEVLQHSKNLTSYNIDKFKSVFKDNFLEDYTTISHIPAQGMRSIVPQIEFETPIIVADYELIHKLLRNISSQNSRLYEIERGSIWEIEIDIIFTHSGGRIIKKDIKYKKFVKKYPIEYNHKPLTFVDKKTFKFDHNTMSYILFNAQNTIPLNFLNGMSFFRLSPVKQLAIQKSVEISLKSVENKKNTSSSKKNNNLSTLNLRNPSFKFD